MRDETQKVQIRNYITDYLTDKAKELIDDEASQGLCLSTLRTLLCFLSDQAELWA